MKAAITDGKGGVWIEDVPRPEPDEYQCLCETLACATCTGTDLKHIHNAMAAEQSYPGMLGHESVGRVIQVGAKVRYLQEGDRVLRPTGLYMGTSTDRYHSMWGGFTEYGLVTDLRALAEDRPQVKPNGYCQYQMKIPSSLDITPADATMLVTLKETAGCIAVPGIGWGSSLVITGSGSVAVSLCRFAKLLAVYPVIVVGRRPAPLAHARKVGADVVLNAAEGDVAARIREATGGKGADYIIDASGDAGFVRRCMEALAPEGKVMPYSTYKRGDNLRDNLAPERTLKTPPSREVQMHQYLIDCVRLGLVTPSDYYSHRMPLDRIAEGFRMIERKEAMKIVFETDHDQDW